jgi:hypothetical protein
MGVAFRGWFFGVSTTPYYQSRGHFCAEDTDFLDLTGGGIQGQGDFRPPNPGTQGLKAYSQGFSLQLAGQFPVRLTAAILERSRNHFPLR